MARNGIIGRKYEFDRLDSCVNSKEAQLIVVYGRRRVGKTYLINRYFDNSFDFKFTGEFGASKDQQLKNFTDEMSRCQGREVSKPADWREAFSQLRDYISDLPLSEKAIVFFDEMPWMETPRSGFLEAFEYFWNSWANAQNNLVFIICGSATSWLTNKIERNKGGLFSRLTCSLYLKPFSLMETEEYLVSSGIEWSRYDIAECYMVMGGIPHYLSLLQPGISYTSNIDNLFFKKRAELWNEFDNLYHTLFSNSDKYISIVNALSKKRMGLTMEEISHNTGISKNGSLSKMLEDLLDTGFIRMNTFYGRKKREALYQLADYYTLFYLYYLKDKSGIDEQFWTKGIGSPSRNAWAGFTFELLCMDHINCIKKALDIAGVLTEQSIWYSKGDDTYDGAQIDLLIDRRDRVINLCEIKFSGREFRIDKDYERALRNKIGAFVDATKCKKTVSLTMITPYGVQNGKYSGLIGGQVELDDLFKW